MTTVPMLLLAAAMSTTPGLDEVIEALGAEESRKDTLGACRYVEKSRVEQLDSKGRVEGSIVREFAVVVTPTSLERTLLSEKREGELSGKLAELPKNQNAAERAASRLPFHPESRRHFKFSSVSAGPEKVTVAIKPLKPDEKRIEGRAVVDARSKQMVSLTAKPSKLPMFVDEIAFDADFAPTPCGVYLTRVKTRGEAGALFVKLRFRMESELRDFRLEK